MTQGKERRLSFEKDIFGEQIGQLLRYCGYQPKSTAWENRWEFARQIETGQSFPSFNLIVGRSKNNPTRGLETSLYLHLRLGVAVPFDSRTADELVRIRQALEQIPSSDLVSSNSAISLLLKAIKSEQLIGRAERVRRLAKPPSVHYLALRHSGRRDTKLRRAKGLGKKYSPPAGFIEED